MESKKNGYSMAAVVMLAAAACLICAMGDGLKNNYGIMLGSIIENSGLGYSSVSLVLAIGQLFYGMIQPFFGILAEKKGNRLTLVLGVLLMLCGMLLLPHCRSAFALTLCLGFLLPSGTGAISYGIVVGSITPKIPAHTVSVISGFVNASSGVGNAVLSPIIQRLLACGGMAMAMAVLAVPTILLIPLSLYVGKKQAAAPFTDGGGALMETHEGAASGSVFTQFKEAFSSRTYRLLMAGFFTCGFHMALISNHLPSQFTSYGISTASSAYAFSVYGIVTMAGSVLSGWLSGKLSMKNVLGTYYGLRMVITLLFLLLPKTLPVIFIYAALLGLTGAATVPPVSGTINREFGAAKIATLYGFVFFIHQIGAFFGAWLAGITLEATGGYNAIWMADMVLCTIAAAASYMIKE